MYKLEDELRNAHQRKVGIIGIRTHDKQSTENLLLALALSNASKVNDLQVQILEAGQPYIECHKNAVSSAFYAWRGRHWDVLDHKNLSALGESYWSSGLTPDISQYSTIKSTGNPIAEVHANMRAALSPASKETEPVRRNPIPSVTTEDIAKLVKKGEDCIYVIPYVNEFTANPTTIVYLEDYLSNIRYTNYLNLDQANPQVNKDLTKKSPVSKTIILLLSPSDELPQHLSNYVQIINDPLPSLVDRQAYLEQLVQKSISMVTTKTSTPDAKFIETAFMSDQSTVESVVKPLSKVTSGLTYGQISNIYWSIMLDIKLGVNKFKVKDLKTFTQSMLESKVGLVNNCTALEYMKPVSMDEVGGLKGVKDFMETRKLAFTEEAVEFGVTRPKGIFLSGIPGTGKSLTAKACGSYLEWPVIRLCLASVYGGLVGQSERKMREALSMLQTLAPAVVFVDEIDKSISLRSSGGDSGTSQRVLGSLLTFMQECEEPLFFVLSANRVDNLPAELTRKGRVDECFGLTFPNPKEVAQVLKIHLTKRGKRPEELLVSDRKALVKSLDRFVPAEIESIVNEAILTRFYKHKVLGESSILELEDFTDVIKVTKRVADTSKEQVDTINAWVKTSARSASGE